MVTWGIFRIFTVLEQVSTTFKIKVMKNKIEVFKTPLSDEVIKTFDNVDDLLKYNETHSLMADQIAINDCILLGWDELYMFLK